jgi:hypothetical protein
MCILSAVTDHISKLQIATKLKRMLIDPVNFFSLAPKYRHIPIINLLLGKLLLLGIKVDRYRYRSSLFCFTKTPNCLCTISLHCICCYTLWDESIFTSWYPCCYPLTSRVDSAECCWFIKASLFILDISSHMETYKIKAMMDGCLLPLQLTQNSRVCSLTKHK